jgi:hypothetical protein
MPGQIPIGANGVIKVGSYYDGDVLQIYNLKFEIKPRLPLLSPDGTDSLPIRNRCN